MCVSVKLQSLLLSSWMSDLYLDTHLSNRELADALGCRTDGSPIEAVVKAGMIELDANFHEVSYYRGPLV